MFAKKKVNKQNPKMKNMFKISNILSSTTLKAYFITIKRVNVINFDKMSLYVNTNTFDVCVKSKLKQEKDFRKVLNDLTLSVLLVSGTGTHLAISKRQNKLAVFI